jgi:type II secretory pathway pseudopilin PulG
VKQIAGQSNGKAAFTIIELLTVMSIIILLMGLLAPSLGMAKRYAQKVAQKHQFKSIGEALEAFSAEEEGYPDSAALPSSTTGGSWTTGAHRLAEAVVGRDLQGFDPFSSWNAADDAARPIYGRGTAPEKKQSLDRRKGPYLQLANVDAFQIGELYGSAGNVYPGLVMDAPAPVLTDVYRNKRIMLLGGVTSERAGSPILYYKADVSANDPALPLGGIYSYQDNVELLALGNYIDPTMQHPFVVGDGTIPGPQLFYDKITNPQIRPTTRPYNQDSYLLISAGYDGLYGTADDVFNFMK